VGGDLLCVFFAVFATWREIICGKEGSRKGAKDRQSLYFCIAALLILVVPKCPTCGKPVERQDNPWRPFCSERCKLIDFGRWTDEEYRVPGPRVNPGEISEQPSPKTSDDED